MQLIYLSTIRSPPMREKNPDKDWHNWWTTVSRALLTGPSWVQPKVTAGEFKVG